MLSFNKNYFALMLLLLLIEIGIALFVHDEFIRPYVGDMLVVILVYCFVKSFLNVGVLAAAVFALTLAFAIEFAQYFNIIELLGWQHSKLARCIIGTTFAWIDLLTYIAGTLLILFVENSRQKAREVNR